MKKSVFWNAVIGMGFGSPITVVCMTLIGGFNEATRELLVWVVASALYGVLSGVMYFGKKELPLPVALGVHCVGCLGITVAAVLLCGYVKGVADMLPVLVPFPVIYAVVYGACLWGMKKDEKEINEALDKK